MIDPAHLELFESDRKEVELYQNAFSDEDIILPLTRTGFEALLVAACELVNLPVNDSGRLLLAGFIHHIERDKNTTKLRDISAALWKQLSNNLTTLIYDEIEQKRRAELKAKLEVVPPSAELVEVPTSNETSA